MVIKYGLRFSEIVQSLLELPQSDIAIREAFYQKISSNREAKMSAKELKKGASEYQNQYDLKRAKEVVSQTKDMLLEYSKDQDFIIQVESSLKETFNQDRKLLMAMLIVNIYDSIVNEWALKLSIPLHTIQDESGKKIPKNGYVLTRDIRNKLANKIRKEDQLEFNIMTDFLLNVFNKENKNFRNMLTHRTLSAPPVEGNVIEELIKNFNRLIYYYNETINSQEASLKSS